MSTANTIESFFALIKPTGKLPVAIAAKTRGQFSSPIAVRTGKTFRLPPGRHVSIVTGLVWLTHRGDSADHFPSAGDSFDTTATSNSVVEALADSTLLIE